MLIFARMSKFSEISFTCPECGRSAVFKRYSSVNAATDPDLRDELRTGRLFVRKCPGCGHKDIDNSPFLYTDPELKLILALSKEKLNSDGEIPGYTARQVTTVGELVEKLKIFEAGLDDIAVEMCKYVTVQELGKDVELKFCGMNGADRDITFTYPENGQMQMLEIGLNVYNDCCGILSRNPVIAEKAKGLVRVDQAWLSGFIG